MVNEMKVLSLSLACIDTKAHKPTTDLLSSFVTKCVSSPHKKDNFTLRECRFIATTTFLFAV